MSDKLMLNEFIVSALKTIVSGVMEAQGQGLPAQLPDEVTFVVAANEGDITLEFSVPLGKMLFDDGKHLVSYTHASQAKN